MKLTPYPVLNPINRGKRQNLKNFEDGVRHKKCKIKTIVGSLPSIKEEEVLGPLAHDANRKRLIIKDIRDELYPKRQVFEVPEAAKGLKLNLNF